MYFSNLRKKEEFLVQEKFGLLISICIAFKKNNFFLKKHFV